MVVVVASVAGTCFPTAAACFPTAGTCFPTAVVAVANVAAAGLAVAVANVAVVGSEPVLRQPFGCFLYRTVLIPTTWSTRQQLVAQICGVDIPVP